MHCLLVSLDTFLLSYKYILHCIHLSSQLLLLYKIDTFPKKSQVAQVEKQTAYSVISARIT